MKVLMAVLTAVSLLAISSVTYAHDSGNERGKRVSRNNSDVSFRVQFGSGGPFYGMHQHDQRYRGKDLYKKHRPFWKKIKYMQRINNRYDRHDRHDRYGRDQRQRQDRQRHDRDRHRHDRHDRHSGNWYDKYF